MVFKCFGITFLFHMALPTLIGLYKIINIYHNIMPCKIYKWYNTTFKYGETSTLDILTNVSFHNKRFYRCLLDFLCQMPSSPLLCIDHLIIFICMCKFHRRYFIFFTQTSQVSQIRPSTYYVFNKCSLIITLQNRSK